MSKPKSYLGDGVYADIDEIGRLVLTTEDGVRATNTIVFEPEVYVAFRKYMRSRPEFADLEAAARREPII